MMITFERVEEWYSTDRRWVIILCEDEIMNEEERRKQSRELAIDALIKIVGGDGPWCLEFRSDCLVAWKGYQIDRPAFLPKKDCTYYQMIAPVEPVRKFPGFLQWLLTRPHS